MAWTDCPTLPLLDSEQSRTGLFRRMFGLHGFGLWGYGISEDHWGVIEQTHNLLGLGYSPAFALSRHRYIRARERLPTEWEGAPYRWSSGLKQTEMDPLEQLAMEFGPLSYFERELRQFAGDFYTVAPFAVLTLLLFPWSIGYGFSAFVGISLVFLFAGDTLNALIFAWHDSGWTGVLRWLRTRPRDIRLFAPRLVLEAMGQVAVYLDPILKGFGEILGEDGGRRLNRVFPRVSNEFALSGVGNWRVRGLRGAFKGSPYWPLWNPGRRPSLFQSYLTVMLLGLVLTLGSFMAMWHGLNALNALMMILPLAFTAAIFVGPLVSFPKPGRVAWRGYGDTVFSGLGFLLSAVAWTLFDQTMVSWMFGELATAILVGLGFVALVLGMLCLLLNVNQDLLRWPHESVATRIAAVATRGFITGLVVLFMWFAITPVFSEAQFDGLTKPTYDLLTAFMEPLTFAFSLDVFSQYLDPVIQELKRLFALIPTKWTPAPLIGLGILALSFLYLGDRSDRPPARAASTLGVLLTLGLISNQGLLPAVVGAASLFLRYRGGRSGSVLLTGAGYLGVLAAFGLMSGLLDPLVGLLQGPVEMILAQGSLAVILGLSAIILLVNAFRYRDPIVLLVGLLGIGGFVTGRLAPLSDWLADIMAHWDLVVERATGVLYLEPGTFLMVMVVGVGSWVVLSGLGYIFSLELYSPYWRARVGRLFRRYLDARAHLEAIGALAHPAARAALEGPIEPLLTQLGLFVSHEEYHLARQAERSARGVISERLVAT